MSEYNDDEETTSEESAKGLRRQLEEALAERKAAEERAAEAERRLAFATAGIDLADPRAKYFVAGYDGEIDPEKIRQAAIEAGFISEPTPPQPQVPAEELEAHQQAADLASQGLFQNPDLQAQYEREIANAVTREEVLRIMDKYGSPRVEVF
jgi:hypothetical protein